MFILSAFSNALFTPPDTACYTPPPMANLRLFIAVDFSPEITQAALLVSRRLRRSLELPGTRVSWVREGGLHITLKFLGDTDESLVSIIAQTMDEVAGRHGQFGVRVKGLGTFPDTGKPRVIWMGLAEGGSELGALAADMDFTLSGLGFTGENRRFQPHLTLGRVREAGHADFASACARLNDCDAGRSTIDSMTLYSSFLDPRGPIYTVRHISDLTAP